jgi:hypothetical protein
MAKKTPASFTVKCPKCLSDDETVVIDLHDLADCHCMGCEHEFSPQDAVRAFEAQAAEWQRVVAWTQELPS